MRGNDRQYDDTGDVDSEAEVLLLVCSIAVKSDVSNKKGLLLQFLALNQYHHRQEQQGWPQSQSQSGVG